MAEGFISEIRLFAFNFAPRNWADCNGQAMPIQQNAALYSLLGITFGGDGKTTFNLPDLRGRLPIQRQITSGSPFPLSWGQKTGSETVSLTTDQMPAHTHAVQASSSEADVEPVTGAVPAFSSMVNWFGPAPSEQSDMVQLSPSTIAAAGEGVGHENRMPGLAVRFCIALTGYYPPRY